MKYIIGSLLVVLTLVAVYAGYRLMFPGDQDGLVQGVVDTRIETEGKIVSGPKKDALYLEYHANGATSTKELIIKETSICKMPTGQQQCIAFNTPLTAVFANAQVKVDGSEVGNTIEVSILERTNRDGPEVEVSAKIGQTTAGLEVRITPLEVLQDSRCPQSVQCIWAGTVKVKTQIVSGMGTSTQIFTLGEPSTTEAEEITLIAVTPAKVSADEVPKQSYVFTYSIKKRDVKY